MNKEQMTERQEAESPRLDELLAKTKFRQQVRARFLANHVCKSGGWMHVVAGEKAATKVS